MSQMKDIYKPPSCNTDKINNDSELTRLAEAIEKTENFLLKENEGRLYRFMLNVIEKPLIENILNRTGGNQLRTARILGINRNTLHTKIRRLNIDTKSFRKM